MNPYDDVPRRPSRFDELNDLPPDTHIILRYMIARVIAGRPALDAHVTAITDGEM